jgi:hypothetical protein
LKRDLHIIETLMGEKRALQVEYKEDFRDLGGF